MRIRMEGVGQLAAASQRRAEDAARIVRREVKRAALAVEAGAKLRAPVDTGRLRNSLTHETSADGFTAEVGTNVEYAPHQEFGTRHMRAQPFLLPALEEERGRLPARIRQQVAREVRR